MSGIFLSKHIFYHYGLFSFPMINTMDDAAEKSIHLNGHKFCKESTNRLKTLGDFKKDFEKHKRCSKTCLEDILH